MTITLFPVVVRPLHDNHRLDCDNVLSHILQHV